MRRPHVVNAMNMQESKPWSGTIPCRETVADRRLNWRRKSRGEQARRSVSGGQVCVSTTTVADKPTGKVVGKPSWGKPDVRFDEGA